MRTTRLQPDPLARAFSACALLLCLLLVAAHARVAVGQATPPDGHADIVSGPGWIVFPRIKEPSVASGTALAAGKKSLSSLARVDAALRIRRAP